MRHCGGQGSPHRPMPRIKASRILAMFVEHPLSDFWGEEVSHRWIVQGQKRSVDLQGWPHLGFLFKHGNGHGFRSHRSEQRREHCWCSHPLVHGCSETMDRTRKIQKEIYLPLDRMRKVHHTIIHILNGHRLFHREMSIRNSCLHTRFHTTKRSDSKQNKRQASSVNSSFFHSHEYRVVAVNTFLCMVNEVDRLYIHHTFLNTDPNRPEWLHKGGHTPLDRVFPMFE